MKTYFVILLLGAFIFGGCATRVAEMPRDVTVHLTGPKDQTFTAYLEEGEEKEIVSGTVPQKFQFESGDFISWFQADDDPGELRLRVYRGRSLFIDRTSRDPSEKVWVEGDGDRRVRLTARPAAEDPAAER
jgi:hypothetical protein